MDIAEARKHYPAKFVTPEQAFRHIHTADRIYVSSGCGEPQYLLRALVDYVRAHPGAFYDAEILHAWAVGDTPYTDERFKPNFRANALFIGNQNREAVNRGFADYTPVFLSQVPALFQRRLIAIDVALIQASLPDAHGYMSLGVSVDMTKQAVASAPLVIAQINSHLPRVHGDGFIHLDEVNFVIPHDEPLLEYRETVADEIAQRIGKYVARIIEDGDTIQVGYGSIPNAILANLRHKKHLGVHTELLTDGVVELMRSGAVDNRHKCLDRGKSVAAFCMGSQETYAYIHDNPVINFRTIDYTDNPLIIARHESMTAVNGALGIDLTGQASMESAGKAFFNGIGGIADFMRGATLARRGKAILTLPSTTQSGNHSRIVPFLREGAGVTLNRGDIHYVVTEYGIAYLNGKNIRERAMDLIAIAHPKFRPWLIEEAKKANLIYRDQLFIPGKAGEYPEDLEIRRVTRSGLEIFLRPAKISDESLLKDLGHRLSDQSLYNRFFTRRADMPHEYLQRFVVVDYSRQMAIFAVLEHDNRREEIIGVGRYFIDEAAHAGEIVLIVGDDYQHQGVGWELLSYLTFLAVKRGLLGFTAEVLLENKPMVTLMRRFFEEEKGFQVEKKLQAGVVNYRVRF